jgi:hypothetical protein
MTLQQRLHRLSQRLRIDRGSELPREGVVLHPRVDARHRQRPSRFLAVGERARAIRAGDSRQEEFREGVTLFLIRQAVELFVHVSNASYDMPDSHASAPVSREIPEGKKS